MRRREGHVAVRRGGAVEDGGSEVAGGGNCSGTRKREVARAGRWNIWRGAGTDAAKACAEARLHTGIGHVEPRAEEGRIRAELRFPACRWVPHDEAAAWVGVGGADTSSLDATATRWRSATLMGINLRRHGIERGRVAAQRVARVTRATGRRLKHRYPVLI
jgi:hypothetical protein